MKYLIIINIIVFCFNTANATSSPLAAYSSQWNLPMFEKANTAANASYLSKSEKEFIYVLNLVRMNPYLFSETVLKPYAQKNGYPSRLLYMMDQMRYARPPIGLLNTYDCYIKELNNWVDSNIKYKTEQNKYLYEHTKMKNTVCFTSTTFNIAELICQMIVDEKASVHSIRNHILSDNKTIFIAIRKEKEYTIALSFDERSPQQIEKEKEIEKERNRKYISYIDCPDDSLLKFYIKKNKIDIHNAFFVTADEISKIEDSVKKINLNISILEGSGSISILKIESNKKNTIAQNDYYVWSSNFSNMRTGDYDSRKYLNVYILKRSIPESTEERLKVVFKQIKTPPILPPFPVDSIGNNLPEIDNNKIDNFSMSVGTMPLKKLADALTKPWKTDAEKVRSIFKWMDYNLKYDYDGLRTGNFTVNPNQILLKKVTICQGYAELFSAICDAAGIKNEIIIGVAKVSPNNFGSHAWNSVCIDKKWYLIDVTWGERYYLKSPKYFFYDHFPTINRWTLLPEFHSFEEFK